MRRLAAQEEEELPPDQVVVVSAGAAASNNSRGGFLLVDEDEEDNDDEKPRQTTNIVGLKDFPNDDKNDSMKKTSTAGFEDRESEKLLISSTSSKKLGSNSTMRLHCRLLIYFVALASVMFVLYATIGRDPNKSLQLEKGTNLKSADDAQFGKPSLAKIRVDVYMESQCPDTTRFINTQLTPTYDELEDYIDLKLYPFGKAKFTKSTNPEGEEDYSFQCQHGARECLGNQLMCCAMARFERRPHKYLPYIACVQGTPPGSREQTECNEKYGLDDGEMQTCTNGREGRLLHKEMGEATLALKPKLNFIPWIIIDGVREKRAFNELKTVICEKLATNFQAKPKPCSLTTTTVVSSVTTALSMRLRRGSDQ